MKHYYKKIYLACSFGLICLMSNLVYAADQNYCISVPDVGGYNVFGYSATITDSVGGQIASFGRFSHKVCYQNTILGQANQKAATNNYYIIISGSILASKGTAGPIYTPSFKCPNISYPIWVPKEIYVTVHFNPDRPNDAPQCTIDKVVQHD